MVKSLTPDRDANAIAGQVDINTLSAFDRPGTFAYAKGAIGISNMNERMPWEADATIGTRLGSDVGVVRLGQRLAPPDRIGEPPGIDQLERHRPPRRFPRPRLQPHPQALWRGRQRRLAPGRRRPALCALDLFGIQGP
ncbi:MAG: hypothetical protein WDN44_13700 [Sphingomonas sp.]